MCECTNKDVRITSRLRCDKTSILLSPSGNSCTDLFVYKSTMIILLTARADATKKASTVLGPTPLERAGTAHERKRLGHARLGLAVGSSVITELCMY